MDRIGQPFVRTAAAFGLVGAVVAALLPARGHVAAASIGFLFVVPLIGAIAIGGLAIGGLVTAGTFFLYDLIYVPPYGSIAMRSETSLLPLIAYVAVLIVVAPLAGSLRRARADAARGAVETRRLFDLTEVLLSNRPLPDLLTEVVVSAQASFGFDSALLLLAADDELEVAAQSGSPMSPDELLRVAPTGGVPRSLGSVTVGSRRVVGVPLAAPGQPIGVLVLAGPTISHEDLSPLRTYTNQAALAVERARLRERALESELLRQVDTWRSALLGAVSHDLRTPLASVKAAVSDLRSEQIDLSKDDAAELLELIESQADRLDRLVANLLDMTRIEFGELELRMEPTSIDKLVTEALGSFGGAAWTSRVTTVIPSDLPAVVVDHVLICQVLANLLENAERYAPEDTPIVVRAQAIDDRVEVTVQDAGPGVAPEDRTRVFKMFNRISGGGRAGIGLAIVESFVEAHGQTVYVEESPGGGARFVFTLPTAGSAKVESS